MKRLLLTRKTLDKRDKVRINVNKLVEKVANNLNWTKSQKYNISSDTIKKKFKYEKFKKIYDFHRLNKVKEDLERKECLNISSDYCKK